MSEEIRLGGFRPEPDSPKHWGYEDKLRPRMHLGATVDVDLREFSGPRHHQQETNSCVANATVKALEIRRIQQFGMAAHVDLSRLAVYYLARELMFPTETHLDQGTYVSHAFDALRRFGVPPEADWPFDLDKISTPPSWGAMRKAFTHKIDAFYKIRSTGLGRVEAVIDSLRTDLPVVFGTTVGRNWREYEKGDVLGAPEVVTGAHATVLVGYRDGLFLGENSWGCYDDQTEVLTKKGWVPWPSVKGGEKFATLNPANHVLEYQQATAHYAYDYDGELLRFSSQGVDLLVTPNHRMYVTNHHKRQSPNWPVVRADSIDGSRRICFKKDAVNNAPDVGAFHVAGQKVEADLWLEFLGYFLSEGHTSQQNHIRTRVRTRKYARKGGALRDGTTGQFVPDPEGVPDEVTYQATESYPETSYIVGLSQSEGEDADCIAQCLHRLPFQFGEGLKPAEERRKPQRVWTHTTRGLYESMSVFGKAPEKHIPRACLQLSARQSRVLLDALMLGDGTKSGGSWTYYTSSPQFADDVQELALRCGFAADIHITDRTNQPGYNHPEYQVGIKRIRVRPEARYTLEQVPYRGKVYCITVPNGLVYVRRNGQAVWSGNSQWGDDGFYQIDPAVIASSASSDFWVPICGWEDLGA